MSILFSLARSLANNYKFQNRRSRAKKDGKVLQKLPHCAEVPEIYLPRVKNRTNVRIIPGTEQVDPVDPYFSECDRQDDDGAEDDDVVSKEH
jgi:hypothetical protein